MEKKHWYFTYAGWLVAVSAFYGIWVFLIVLLLVIAALFLLEYVFLKTKEVRSVMWGIAGALISAVLYGIAAGVGCI